MQTKNKTNNLPAWKTFQKPSKVSKNTDQPLKVQNTIKLIPDQATNHNPQRSIKANKAENKAKYYFGTDHPPKRQRRNSGSKETSHNNSKSNLLRVKTEQHSLTFSQVSKDFELNLNYKGRMDKRSLCFTKKRTIEVQGIVKKQNQGEQQSNRKQVGKFQAQNELIRKLNDRISCILNETEKLGNQVEESFNQRTQVEEQSTQMLTLSKSLNLLEVRILNFCKSAGKVEHNSSQDRNEQQSKCFQNVQLKDIEEEELTNNQFLYDKQP